MIAHSSIQQRLATQLGSGFGSFEMDPATAVCQFCFSYGLVQDHGVLVCSACGQQQQGFIEEGENDGAGMARGVRTLHLTRQKSATQSVTAVARRTFAETRQSSRVKDALRLYVPCLQNAFREQARVLCAEFRAPEEQLGCALWTLWAAHLARTKALEPATWRKAEQRIAGETGDPGDAEGMPSVFHLDLRLSIAKVCYAIVPPSSLLTLLALAVHMCRLAVTALDILRAAADGRLPYLDLAHVAAGNRWDAFACGAHPGSRDGDGDSAGRVSGAPGNRASAGRAGGGPAAAGSERSLDSLPGGDLLALAMQPKGIPMLPELMERMAWEASPASARSTALGGTPPLGIKLPPVNVPLLLQRFAAELELPQAVPAAATELYRLRASSSEFYSWTFRGTPPYTAVAALLVVTLQLLYGLDGLPRRYSGTSAATDGPDHPDPAAGAAGAEQQTSHSPPSPADQSAHGRTGSWPGTGPADEPVNEPVDEPVDEPADEPVDEPADEPADEAVDEPVPGQIAGACSGAQEMWEAEVLPPPPPACGWPNWAARQVQRVLQPNKWAMPAAELLRLPAAEWRSWLTYLRCNVFREAAGPPELEHVLTMLAEIGMMDGVPAAQHDQDAPGVELDATSGDTNSGRGTSSGSGGSGVTSSGSGVTSSGSGTSSGGGGTSSSSSDSGTSSTSNKDDCEGASDGSGGQRQAGQHARKRRRVAAGGERSKAPALNTAPPGGGAATQGAGLPTSAGAAVGPGGAAAPPPATQEPAAPPLATQKPGALGTACLGGAPAAGHGQAREEVAVLPPGEFVAWSASAQKKQLNLHPTPAAGMHPEYVAVLAATAALVWASPWQLHQYSQMLLTAMDADERALERKQQQASKRK